MARSLHVSVVLYGLLCRSCTAFPIISSGYHRPNTLFARKPHDDGTKVAPKADDPLKSRRDFTSRLITGAIIGVPGLSVAKDSSLESDKKKLVEGYSRLTYLLDNWEKETTVCGTSDNPYVTDAGCERTPLKVMEYLGYRDTKHPLFKAEKTLQRLEALVPAEKEAEYLDAVEKWIESADEGNGMAYISSWGEANPGGGKDRVLVFIQRAKKNVVDARDSLATAITILDLSS